MIYVYIKNWGIIKKSEIIINWLSYDSVEQVDYDIHDKLICEDGKVVKYTESEQYKKDNWIVWVAEERDLLKEQLKQKVKEHDELINDYLRLRTQYDLLRKRNTQW